MKTDNRQFWNLFGNEWGGGIIAALIVLFAGGLGMWLHGCTQSPTTSGLKNQEAIVVHDGRGHTYVLRHVSGDTWELH